MKGSYLIVNLFTKEGIIFCLINSEFSKKYVSFSKKILPQYYFLIVQNHYWTLFQTVDELGPLKQA